MELNCDQSRRLGSNGPLVSEIGWGCMGMSFAYGPRDDEDSARTLNPRWIWA